MLGLQVPSRVALIVKELGFNSFDFMVAKKTQNNFGYPSHSFVAEKQLTCVAE